MTDLGELGVSINRSGNSDLPEIVGQLEDKGLGMYCKLRDI
jgi:hypothetical protein